MLTYWSYVFLALTHRSDVLVFLEVLLLHPLPIKPDGWHRSYNMTSDKAGLGATWCYTGQHSNPWHADFILGNIRDHSGRAPSQWEPALHCKAGSHWLGAHPEWSLEHIHFLSFLNIDMVQVVEILPCGRQGHISPTCTWYHGCWWPGNATPFLIGWEHTQNDLEQNIPQKEWK